MGTLEWRYRLALEGSATRVTESYVVLKPVTAIGWFLLGTVLRDRDRRATLRAGMRHTLSQIKAAAESESG
ncbi:hypothetical protein HH308_13425 [Gordonia sp. TBRC 11910]|uniref:Polyketide cyclase / dehydrase and lipid transport n=1 Tax=Gordonia asplenii TaxID=2725283 RepID=A0A848L0Q0_9ACTN|nr:hypothetical protein [Gordonia asplenii]NMO02213.1 hypothetical protein [Gordonia asplenii]